MNDMYCDVVIVGCGVAGLYAALWLPPDKRIVMLSKEDLASCDSMLAQGGICVLRDESDYDSYFEDTLRAGHYENRRESVELMIRGSRAVIDHLLALGVRFEKNADGSLAYTREGAHSAPRICFHKDITGEEITLTLLARVRERANTVLATGGIGGLYEHSTNFPLLTGDGCAAAKRHGIRLAHMDYVQIHPTCLYSTKPGRSFLISESARGEGAVLLNHSGERFVNELLPRDAVTKAVHEEMEKEGVPHEYLSFAAVPEETILGHFPHIFERCLAEGYDIRREPVPIVPAQHYFMGGIYVNRDSATTMAHLYAVGETSCNGVHGKNRLASNSLLESMVFAKRAAEKITENQERSNTYESNYNEACC